jgi:glycosyltransferase involved in cell wall biosynthesis
VTAREVSPSPRVSVIVPTYNRPKQLGDCLTALARQTYPLSDFEVLIVDDGSEPPIADVVTSFGDRLDAHVIRQARKGAAAARNSGIKSARGVVIAFTDDDCRPTPDWLEKLAARLAGTGDLLVGGRVVNALGDNLFSSTSQLIHEMAHDHHNANGEPAQFFNCNNMAVHAESLVRLGGFDPAFHIASEDRDLCARWHESGRALVYAPEAEVGHAHYLTLTGFWTQHFRYGRGAWRYHDSLRKRGRGHFTRDLGSHGGFLRRARSPLAQRRNTVAIGALLIVWQVANLVGFVYEALASRLPSAGPAAKIS